jgi:hypothetical protein
MFRRLSVVVLSAIIFVGVSGGCAYLGTWVVHGQVLEAMTDWAVAGAEVSVGDSVTQTEQPYHLTGVIHDAWNGAPVARAIIRVNGLAGGSDAVGRYSVPLVETSLGENKYLSCEVEAPGYLPWRQEIRYVNPQPGNVSLDIALTPDMATETVQVAVAQKVVWPQGTVAGPAGTAPQVVLQPYALQGVVRDAVTRAPLPRALIYLNDGTIVAADDTGAYRLPTLPNNPVLSVKAGGYRKATFDFDSRAVTPADAGLLAPCAQNPAINGQTTAASDPLCLDINLAPATIKGLYIPFGLLSRPERVRELVDLVDRSELNAFVVDVKSDRGLLAYPSQVPLAIQLGVGGDRKGWMTLKELLALAREKQIYTVARIVVFKDDPLAHGRPDLAVVRGDGTLWKDLEGLAWSNPFREEVWEYNIGIAKEVAALGFDEVQFDYIRFPSDGDVNAIVYRSDVNTLETRTKAIHTFTWRLTDALRPYGVFTSADLFGLTLWVEQGSDMNIGQRVDDIAPFMDYLCPMVYPSTFRTGNLGYRKPDDYPYEVVYRSIKIGQRRMPAWTKVRPWLQAYWYDVSQMIVQKQAAADAGVMGWTFWNAGGVYPEGLFPK